MSFETNRPTKQEPKEPYSTPKLTVYGTVEQLTKKVGVNGQMDNGSFPNIRTRFG